MKLPAKYYMMPGKTCKRGFLFETLAVCLLPESTCIASGSCRSAMIIILCDGKKIKRLFTRGYLSKIGYGEERNQSRQKRGRLPSGSVAFWEHTIETEEDLEIHLDYIHFNPVKHGYVKHAADWSFPVFNGMSRKAFMRLIGMAGRRVGFNDCVGNELLGGGGKMVGQRDTQMQMVVYKIYSAS